MDRRIIAAIAVIIGLVAIGCKPDNDNATAASQRGPVVLGLCAGTSESGAKVMSRFSIGSTLGWAMGSSHWASGAAVGENITWLLIVVVVRWPACFTGRQRGSSQFGTSSLA